MKFLGRHLLVEYYDCDREILNDLDQLEVILIEAANKSGAEVMDTLFYPFQPQGITGVVIIAESHVCIHTYPESGYAIAVFLTCGEKADPWKAYDYLKMKLRAHSTIKHETKMVGCS